tara:strand:- start:2 stop:316 length:315 start_codon:yes stop_codon:yes gene_type:complete
MIIEAIRELGVKEFVCDSSPDTEETFNRSYKSLSEDNPKITWEEVSPMIKNLQAEYDAQEYARDRASTYPSIGDQLDMQYHDQLDGTTTWKDAIAKVKSDNPKE